MRDWEGALRPLCFLAFTVRAVHGRTLILPISARYRHKKEIDHYENPPSQKDANPAE